MLWCNPVVWCGWWGWGIKLKIILIILIRGIIIKSGNYAPLNLHIHHWILICLLLLSALLNNFSLLTFISAFLYTNVQFCWVWGFLQLSTMLNCWIWIWAWGMSDEYISFSLFYIIFYIFHKYIIYNNNNNNLLIISLSLSFS